MDIKDFAKNITHRDGVQTYCKQCKRQNDRDYYTRKHRIIRVRLNQNRLNIKKWFRELKSSLTCTKCTENHPACLTFHHNDPTKKEHNISDMIHRVWSRKKVLEEMEKCTVLCENCHRKLHWDNFIKDKDSIKGGITQRTTG